MAPDEMPVRYVRSAQRATPTGDPNFVVQQSMPGAVPENESDPFLMCDEFGPKTSRGAHGTDSDSGFEVAWHPHHGMDILSYFVAGNGRHADSLGNREIFRSPGFQWLSVGSGIEHAEGGGTPEGELEHGFQIWLRMPTAKMRDAPRYGTVEPEKQVVVPLDAAGSVARVIAGPFRDAAGPAEFAVAVQMLDVELKPNVEFAYERPEHMDNVMFYNFAGSGVLNGDEAIGKQQICRFDTSGGRRKATFAAGDEGARFLVFTGKMTREPVVWHGPFVCADREMLMDVFRQHQTGAFPPVRVPYNYKDARARGAQVTPPPRKPL